MPITGRYVHHMQSSDVGQRGGDDVSPSTAATPGSLVETPPNDEADQVDEPGTTSIRRRIDWKLALAALPISIGLALIGFGLLRSVSGDDVTNLPDAIEGITPTPDAVQVLAQTNVIVDLAEGYEGRLIVDGVQFETQAMEDLIANPEPGTQVDIPAGVVFERGNAVLTFTPGPDIEIKRFSEGSHTVQVIYWRTEIGESDARSYTWVFNIV